MGTPRHSIRLLCIALVGWSAIAAAKSRPVRKAEDRKEVAKKEFQRGLETKGDENLAAALAHFQAAQAADPQPEYKQEIDKTIARCVELYLEGYVNKTIDPDVAKKSFAIACACLPAKHEKHDRACEFHRRLSDAGEAAR